ncbi:MAG: type I-C CRISPR-associated protein Cas8c/Csd1, partial [Clostridia bacterium]|nr:type I-C CRISPR-associated protein Cas8c/Csd1 [Clostridia bacterium]
MSWMQKLYEVYEACAARDLVGKKVEGQAMLLPVYHTTQQAQIEVAIDMQGNWQAGSAFVIMKEDQETLIPCTEKSANRTSSPEPMPLFDKLAYLAGDFEQYCESKERKVSPHQLYVDALAAWCASPYAHPVARAWLAYVRKGHLIGDLLAEGIFQLDENGKLAEKWKGTGKPQDAFIRFRARRSDGEERAWFDKELSQSFIAYQNSLSAESDICYVLGQSIPVSAISPRFIRYPGDGAKLVSANDSSGFTYRGRFQTAEEAFVLGRETTEKAHAALKYLIRKQAYRNGDQVVLCFGTGGVAVPKPTDDTVAIACEENLMDDPPAPTLLSLK